jgi:pimeloyl-ACP methyl ester carboxylesterase
MRVVALRTVRFGVDASSSTSAGHRESPAKAVAVEGMANATIPCQGDRDWLDPWGQVRGAVKSIRAIAQRVAPFLPMRLLLRDPYESWRYAPKVTCPTLVIAASHDEIVPLADFWEALVNGK